MTEATLSTGIEYFPDPSVGRPLFNGTIFVGIVDLDPTIEANRISVTVIQEDGTRVVIAPAAQPLVTNSGGLITYLGEVVSVIVEGAYSLIGYRSNGTKAYYIPHARSEITITDVDGFYSGSTLEEVLAEVNTSVDTVADLRLLEPTAVVDNKKSIFLRGYYAAGDNGSGMFYWDSASVEADNGGTIIQATAVTMGRWKRLIDGDWNVTWFGARGDGVADDTAAIVAADAAASAVGLSGEIIIFPSGTYRWLGSITPSAGINWTAKGQSQFSSMLKAIDATSVITITNQTIIKGFQIEGSTTVPGTLVGTGIYLRASLSNVENCMIRYFQTGIRLAGGFWEIIKECRLAFNQINIDFNAEDATWSTNALHITECYNSLAERNGIAATYVPIKNVNIKISGGSIESNCTEDSINYPQIALGLCIGFSLENVYLESRNVTPAPSTINLNGSGQGSIFSCYFDTAEKHIFATAAVEDVLITACRFLGSVTSTIDLPTPNTGVYAIGCTVDIDPVIAGSNSGWIRSKIAEMPAEGAGGNLVATLEGEITPGSPSYVWQYLYHSQVGNIIHFNGAIRVTALGAPAGDMIIDGLPIAARNASVGHSIINLLCDFVIPPGNTSHMIGRIQPNQSHIELWWQTNNSSTSLRVQPADLGATTRIYYSGSYPVAAGVHV